jgi:hypothetical protein
MIATAAVAVVSRRTGRFFIAMGLAFYSPISTGFMPRISRAERAS